MAACTQHRTAARVPAGAQDVPWTPGRSTVEGARGVQPPESGRSFAASLPPGASTGRGHAMETGAPGGEVRAIEAPVARRFASLGRAPGAPADWAAFAADFRSEASSGPAARLGAAPGRQGVRPPGARPGGGEAAPERWPRALDCLRGHGDRLPLPARPPSFGRASGAPVRCDRDGIAGRVRAGATAHRRGDRGPARRRTRRRRLGGSAAGNRGRDPARPCSDMPRPIRTSDGRRRCSASGPSGGQTCNRGAGTEFASTPSSFGRRAGADHDERPAWSGGGWAERSAHLSVGSRSPARHRATKCRPDATLRLKRHDTPSRPLSIRAKNDALCRLQFTARQRRRGPVREGGNERSSGGCRMPGA